ncbi:glycosyltransferase family 2 protein [Agromyces archimandritae]|uniref:Glycosyltransferase family 2 protein n=1 Tax=Agromyces archimandritae TaxID=2781962 RepID=A0A975IP50_9MICO|nr:glycosyltransferase family 2 protein [Agromyces archimandritae]QTX05240.1 glycosyltransferase family 2 protein [Agromyces archimandritae]
MLKVSVIVPTYRSGDGLDRLIASLERQSMPAEEFEVLLVDDGSPDDTFERIERIAATRPNVHASRIEASGWPSRPRNTALDVARGEYVVFLDHDDELATDGLRAAYELATRTGADVVSGKESHTKLLGWALTVYTENRDNVLDPLDPPAVMPMNPHKMYRRALLEEHGIRFPERGRAGGRPIWEDIHFNIDVYAHARVLPLLADTAFYRWVHDGTNTSTDGYESDREEYWTELWALIAHIREALAHRPELRDWLLLVQYRSRILGFARSATFDGDQFRDAEARLLAAVDDLLTPELEAGLSLAQRAETHLARAGRFDLVRELAEVDRGVAGEAGLDDLRWEGGRLVVSATAVWSRPGGGVAGPLLRRTGEGRVVRDLPERLGAALPAELIDVTDELPATSAHIGIRDESDSSVWLLPTTMRPQQAVDAAGTVTMTVRERCELDVDRGVFGRRLHDGMWTVNSSVSLLSLVNHRGIAYRGPALPALVSGRLVVAFANRWGRLALDVGGAEHRLFAVSRPDLAGARAERVAGGIRLEVPLRGLAAGGEETRLAGEVEAVRADAGGRRGRPAADGAARPGIHGTAEIVGDARGGRLVARLPRLRRGTYRLRLSSETAPGREETVELGLQVARGRIQPVA